MSAAPLKKPPRRSSSKWITRLVIIGAIAGGVAMLPRLMKKKPLLVKTVKVEKATVRDEVSSSTAGEVAPDKKALVRAELGGRVVSVRRERGDRVKRGEVVVTVDASDADARAAQALATAAAQEAQVAQAQARVETMARQAARARSLLDKGAGAAQVAEDAAAAEREAREALRAAQGLLAQAQAGLRVARVARGKADLTAPFDGVLTEVHPDPGDQLAPGAPVFEVMDDVRLHVEATVDEADIGRISVGQTAVLKLDALPGKLIPAKLAKIAPAVKKDLKGARTLAIDVDVADVDEARKAGLRAGMSANVDILVAEKPNVISLPTNAIVGRGAKRTVFKLENGFAKVVPVEVGLSNWDRSEIISGLSVGDQVVATLNAKELADGIPVTTAGPGKD
jgi:HlyD family secretion protein